MKTPYQNDILYGYPLPYLLLFQCSRIQFYASIFQSLAATEARFHAEMTKVDEDFAAVMDGLASEAATAIHTTKKERTLDST